MERVFPISTGRSVWADTASVKWGVQLFESVGGMVRALVERDLPKYEWSIKFDNLDTAELNAIRGFYNLCKGPALPFFIKNVEHCKVEGQLLAPGADGKYQLVKLIDTYAEPVYKVDKLVVYVNGVRTTNYTEANGKLTISTAGTVTADYEYYERVRFNGDLSSTEKFHDLHSCTIKVVSAK